MRHNFFQNLKSFRARILVSYLVLICLLIIWTGVYFWLNSKRNRHFEYSRALTSVHNEFLKSSVLMQNFMVSGYHDSDFYSSENQKDIDGFILTQQDNIKHLENLKAVSEKLDYTCITQLEELIANEKMLVDSVLIFKELYFERGFRDFGVEGQMRDYAHALEESVLLAMKGQD
jgi:hypothetical protein